MTELKKNDSVRLFIEDFTKEGEGIGHVDGYTLFVKDAVIGDQVMALVTKAKKNYAFAKMTEILVPSPDRVKPRCANARRCGGCRFQEYSYEKQLEWKRAHVKDVMVRIGGFPDLEVRPVIGMEDPWRYRNKAQYPVGVVKKPDGSYETAAGFYAGRTHFLIETDDCVLTHEINGQIVRRFVDFLKRYNISPYDEQNHTGLVRHLLIREGFATGEILVCPVINGDRLPHADELISLLREVPGVKSICLNVNKEKGNVILGEQILPLYGNPWIEDVLLGNRFRISPRSFYQVNPVQTEKLYTEALRAADLKGTEVVYDLYCGIGTISLCMASRAREVYGVEIVPDAVRDAKENALRNGIGNVHFYTGAAEDLVVRGEFEPGVPCPKADVVVLDPPRKGCDASLIDAVLKMAPDRIVYVSCDPATLARDLKLFAEGRDGVAFKPVYAQPTDLFGHTVHVETVCLLSKLSEAKNHISVKVDMDEMDVQMI